MNQIDSTMMVMNPMILSRAWIRYQLRTVNISGIGHFTVWHLTDVIWNYLAKCSTIFWISFKVSVWKKFRKICMYSLIQIVCIAVVLVRRFKKTPHSWKKGNQWVWLPEHTQNRGANLSDESGNLLFAKFFLKIAWNWKKLACAPSAKPGIYH